MPQTEKYLSLNNELYDYMFAHGHNRDPLLEELSAETAKLGPIAGMQISPEEGTLMGILARAINARSAIEVGTFTGSSAICVARALAPGGRLVCLDASDEWTRIARRYFERAGLADRITLRIGPAAETLATMPLSETFDFAFIDADKTNYRLYYEEILKRLRPGGLLLIDNVLWGGQVIDPADNSDDTKAIRELNDFIATDQRVEAVMIAVADGLTIVRRR